MQVTQDIIRLCFKLQGLMDKHYIHLSTTLSTDIIKQCHVIYDTINNA